mmetsp:Transcript_130005/g.362215  ORF Transcript_130005/g.362215 Transcript_130005/m.362215 type:complete len:236 (+) Transcript_130005:1046-1753(+)
MTMGALASCGCAGPRMPRGQEVAPKPGGCSPGFRAPVSLPATTGSLSSSLPGGQAMPPRPPPLLCDPKDGLSLAPLSQPSSPQDTLPLAPPWLSPAHWRLPLAPSSTAQGCTAPFLASAPHGLQPLPPAPQPPTLQPLPGQPVNRRPFEGCIASSPPSQLPWVPHSPSQLLPPLCCWPPQLHSPPPCAAGPGPLSKSSSSSVLKGALLGAAKLPAQTSLRGRGGGAPPPAKQPEP